MSGSSGWTWFFVPGQGLMDLMAVPSFSLKESGKRGGKAAKR